MSTSVYALLTNTPDAHRIVEELRQRGYRSDDISLLFSAKQTTRDFAYGTHTRAIDGVPTGLAAGGGSLGWLMGIGRLAIPGVGLFVAAGPIMVALSGAVLGSAAGGIASALIGMGIPDDEAQRFAGRIRAGNILISVSSDEGPEIAEIADVFSAWGATEIATAHEAPVPAGQGT